MTQPTGVFVRLHDGALNEEQIAKLCNPKRTMTESLLAIGTPVAGGELEVVGYADAADLPLSDGGPTNWTADISAKPDEHTTEALVRQSDALAKLAEKDAEIARLNAAINTARVSIVNGNPMKAAYVIEAVLKDPAA